ncbi:DUF1127 domain-containing protein [Tropicimonas sp.]|uniref:DUF1127 domain-containing protein n=1 Tax=Tropicimonas sp. TaxID=2067044 RepID=UPI003A8C4B9B
MSDIPARRRLAPIGSLLAVPLHAAWRMLRATTRHNQRSCRADYLNRLSDEQLARRGLSRRDIPRHVFRRFPSA